MIEPPFTFFKMQDESVFRHSPELCEACFGVTPKTFDAVDVVRPVGELVFAMFDAEVFVITHIDKPVVSPPSVGVDDAGNVGFAQNDALERCFGTIGDDFGVDAALAFEEAEHDGFAVGAAAAAPTHAFRPEVRLVNFDDAGLSCHFSAFLGDRLAQEHVIAVDGVDVKPAKGCCLAGGKVSRKHLHQAAEFRFGNVCTFEYVVTHCVYKYN